MRSRYKAGLVQLTVFLNLSLTNISGCSVARLARHAGGVEVGGSNPLIPTNLVIGQTKTLLIV